MDLCVCLAEKKRGRRCACIGRNETNCRGSILEGDEVDGSRVGEGLTVQTGHSIYIRTELPTQHT